MRRWKILLATVLLAAGLCACEKADPVDPARLPGTWSKVYPEGVVTEGSVCWTFREDGVLHVRVYDVFSGNYETDYAYRVEADGRGLTIWEPMYGGEPDWAKYRMVRCDGTTLVLTREEVYAKVATGVEGKVTWFEGDVTFRRSAGN